VALVDSVQEVPAADEVDRVDSALALLAPGELLAVQQPERRRQQRVEVAALVEVRDSVRSTTRRRILLPVHRTPIPTKVVLEPVCLRLPEGPEHPMKMPLQNRFMITRIWRCVPAMKMTRSVCSTCGPSLTITDPQRHLNKCAGLRRCVD
jgi:hypothetical protein